MGTITDIGKLLELPNLEEQTIKDVNQKIRDMLAATPVEKPTTNGETLVALQQKAAEMLGSETVQQWVYGVKPNEGGTS